MKGAVHNIFWNWVWDVYSHIFRYQSISAVSGAVIVSHRFTDDIITAKKHAWSFKRKIASSRRVGRCARWLHYFTTTFCNAKIYISENVRQTLSIFFRTRHILKKKSIFIDRYVLISIHKLMLCLSIDVQRFCFLWRGLPSSHFRTVRLIICEISVSSVAVSVKCIFHY